MKTKEYFLIGFLFVLVIYLLVRKVPAPQAKSDNTIADLPLTSGIDGGLLNELANSSLYKSGGNPLGDSGYTGSGSGSVGFRAGTPLPM